jgi:pimeloyl-ACP methyl ester carboxylesterase
VSYDRPGYGRSDRDEGRTVADAALDVMTIARALGIGVIEVDRGWYLCAQSVR